MEPVNEHGFTRAVTRLLPSEVHCQSMTTAAMSYAGTPDRYLDYKRDLWVEFKYAKHVGRSGIAIGRLLSPLQRRWLRRRFDAGGNACVVVGVPSDRARGFVLESPEVWEAVVAKDWVIQNVKNAPELAAQLLRRVE